MKRKTYKSKRLILLILFGLLTLHLNGQELKPGDKAPEIEQKLITGEDFKLSDLRGKLVMLDFWAAWCKPCRQINPLLVQLYEEYKDVEYKNAEGFTIVSVSLDHNIEMCKKAIEKDNLYWPYHIGGKSGWKHPAALQYNVNSIPTSFLIDADGKLIGVYMRGDEVERALRKRKKGNFLPF
jgi:thiol-disulfide isomerase/thioredoxin